MARLTSYVLVICLAAPFVAAATALRLAQRRTPVVEVFEQARGSVVNISSTHIVKVRSRGLFDSFFEDLFDAPFSHSRQVESVGSGFVLHPAGYIITNAHVVARTAKREVVFADGSKFAAKVVADDPQHDLAILKIESDRRLEPIKMGTSVDLMVGETVIAIGNALGYQHTVTAGVVSALNRTIEVGEDVAFTELIQTDASINPGNSGGPLLNVLGELVGINTAIRADAENIGFAIPVDKLREILPELLDVEHLYNLFMGLQVSTDSACTVTDVETGSPAEEADVRVGDIMTEFDGLPIVNGSDYHIALIGRRPGDSFRVTVLRGSRKIQKTITPRTRPKPDGAKLLARHFGFKVEPVTRKKARAMRLPVSGLVVRRVEQLSPADQIGLRRGDIVIQIGRYHPTTLDDVGLILDRVKSGQRLLISYLRVDGRFLVRDSHNILVR